MSDDPNFGGWPDAARPGYPLHPERDGWHWVRWAGYEPGMEFTAFWSSGEWSYDWAHLAGDRQASCYTYLGPCRTPSEVAARIEAARREEREENAKLAERIISPWSLAASDELAAAIRARGDA